jgi:hypothetical protein
MKAMKKSLSCIAYYLASFILFPRAAGASSASEPSDSRFLIAARVNKNVAYARQAHLIFGPQLNRIRMNGSKSHQSSKRF